jgi:aminomethyltransferase
MSETAIAAPPGVRHSVFVPGRGACRFTVEPGAGAVIVDLEGSQRAVLFVAGEAVPAGCSELLPTTAPGTVVSLPAFAAEYCDPDAQAAVNAAWADGFDTARCYGVFSDSGAPGRRAVVEADAPLSCLLLVPGRKMSPEEQLPSTMVQIILSMDAARAPAPLATPKLDIRVPGATASAYRVAAGDYIQIVDIAGKQCSDFIAFDAAALEAGEEFGIDATATRTLMGHTMPAPGLHGKYFDARLRPVLEMVRDTVGRHDAFLLACTAKYYADQGYPGHANCSDNFNRAIAPYGVAPRGGGAGLKFF